MLEAKAVMTNGWTAARTCYDKRWLK